MKFSEIWVSHCETAREILSESGVIQALDYLVGDKFLKFVEAAEDDAEFREELPAFTAEISTIFEPWQLADYFEQALQPNPFETSDDDLDNDDLEEDDTAEIALFQTNNLAFVEQPKALLLGE